MVNNIEVKKMSSDVAIDTAPVTLDRMPYIPSEGDELVDPGTVRASIAADRQHPHGNTDGGWAEMRKTETVLQQHCLCFDQDHHGIIYPHDTFIACRKRGWSVSFSLLLLRSSLPFVSTTVQSFSFSSMFSAQWHR